MVFVGSSDLYVFFVQCGDNFLIWLVFFVYSGVVFACILNSSSIPREYGVSDDMIHSKVDLKIGTVKLICTV